MSFQPVIIIGAGRSGTNILRDTLITLDDWHTWDCDEINLIWRHGNISLSDDIMNPSHLRPEVASYIQRAFQRQHALSGCPIILEKTCANSLRVPFIDEVFPDARYIYIVRDGRDVALSAAKRWTASIEFPYLIKKLRYVPVEDIPAHGVSFVGNRLAQLFSGEKRQSLWGPRFPGMKEWSKSRPLIEVCAKQWSVCVEESDRAFANMSSKKHIKISYEALVAKPNKTISDILDWYYGEGHCLRISQDALSEIHAGSMNSWKRKLSVFTDEALEIMSDALEKHGYEPSV